MASDKRHVELGSHDLQGQSGKPRAGTYVYQTQRAFASIAASLGEVVELRDRWRWHPVKSRCSISSGSRIAVS